MLGSRNTFFSQTPLLLKWSKESMNLLLTLKKRGATSKSDYNKAFDFFSINPEKYDGATVVKDLVDFRTDFEYLDIDAMLHDYEYVKGANKSFTKKWKSDIRYIKNMEMNGKGIRIPRFIILTLIGIVFVPYKKYISKK